jgi:hypothetical protein
VKEFKMTIPQLPGLAEPASDHATKAFDRLRGEVALLRRALEGLAVERASIEIPDYSETLAQITTAVETTDQRLVTLSQKPAFGLSPQGFSHEIIVASEKIRREDRETITESRQALQQVAKDLIASMRSAREEARQLELLVWTGSGCFAVGMMTGVSVVEPAARAVLRWTGHL